MAPSGVLVMRGAAVRLPRRRCASSAPSPPFLLQSLSVHQRLPTLEVAFSHIITLIGRRAYRPGFTAFHAYRARNEWWMSMWLMGRFERRSSLIAK